MQIPPQGFSQYPRPQGTPSGVRPLPPGAHLECINEAWSLFRSETATWVGAAAILLVGYLVFYVPTMLVGQFLQFGEFGFFPPPGKLPSFTGMVASWGIGLIPAAVMAGLGAGMLQMAIKQMRGQPIAVGDVFGAFNKLPQLFVAYVCGTILYLVGIVLCIIPGLWVIGAFSLTPFFILDQNQGPFEAMASSYRAAGSFSTGISMFGVLFVLGLISGLGFAVCCIGSLATLPVYLIGWAVHYYYFFPEQFAVQPSPIPPPQG